MIVVLSSCSITNLQPPELVPLVLEQQLSLRTIRPQHPQEGTMEVVVSPLSSVEALLALCTAKRSSSNAPQLVVLHMHPA